MSGKKDKKEKNDINEKKSAGEYEGFDDKTSGSEYEKFDDKMFPTNDKLSVAGGVKPFTVYRGIEMGLCAAAVIAGLLYLYTDVIGLGVLLPSYSVGMIIITVLRYLDAKKTGAKGFWAYLPVVIAVALAVLVTVVTGVYFR